MAKSDSTATNSSAATVGLEAKLRAIADGDAEAPRNNMDASEYKHSFLTLEQTQSANAEGPSEYGAKRIFWVSHKACRLYFMANAALQPTIGKTIGDALVSIMRDNPLFKDVLPKDYALAKPPLNDPDCPGEHDGGSRQYGYTAAIDTDYVWMRSPIHQLDKLEV